MILSAALKTPGGETREARIDLNFSAKTWSLPKGVGDWAGVAFSDQGRFEVKEWGVIWLWDGLGSSKNHNTVIFRGAPSDEMDASHQSGAGRVFDPANAKFKDCSIDWRMVQRSPILNSSGLSRVRERAKAICYELLPPVGKYTNGVRPAGATGTGCGEFPGRVLRRMPCKVQGMPGAFMVKVPSAGDFYLNSPSTHWENFALEIDKTLKPAKNTWVPFTGGNRPKTGDIYLLKMFDKADFQHVGMIIKAEGNNWLTADGGQGVGVNKGWQSGLIERKFHADGQIDGEFGSKARLKGWVDLDNLFEVARSSFPPNF